MQIVIDSNKFSWNEEGLRALTQIHRVLADYFNQQAELQRADRLHPRVPSLSDDAAFTPNYVQAEVARTLPVSSGAIGR